MAQKSEKILESFEANNICSFCSRFLNVEPIYTIYNDVERKLDAICGRCTHVLEDLEEKNKNRQFIYEKIASSISYPCSNENLGCKAKLNWGEVEKHEEECIYQIKDCLFANDLFPNIECSWKGSLSSFNKHVEEVHKNSIFDNQKFEFKDDQENRMFFIRFKNMLVTVIIKYENEKYYCLLMLNVTDLESNNYRYKMIFYDEEKNNMFALFKNRLEPLHSIKKTIQNKKKMLEIDLIKIGEFLRNPNNILIKFEIGTIIKMDKNKRPIEVGDDTRLTYAKSIVNSQLECPVCYDVMASPIFFCNLGHSICNQCKVKLSQCPICQAAFSNGRNYSLEKVLKRLEPPSSLDENRKRRKVIKVPCDNKINGCTFEATIDKIPEHESDCKYMNIKCPCCNNQFLKNCLLDHFRRKHAYLMKYTDSFQTTPLIAKNAYDKQINFNKMYVLFDPDELFRLSINETAEKYEFAIFNYDHLDLPNKQPRFWYRLEIREGSTSNVSLTLNNSCYYFSKYHTFPVHNVISLPKNVAQVFGDAPEIKISIRKYTNGIRNCVPF